MTHILNSKSEEYLTTRRESNQLSDIFVELPLTSGIGLTLTTALVPQIRSTGNQVKFIIGSVQVTQALNAGDQLATWPSAEYAPIANTILVATGTYTTSPNHQLVALDLNQTGIVLRTDILLLSNDLIFTIPYLSAG